VLDLAARRLGRDAGSQDHGLAEELVLVSQRFAGVEPDAHADRLGGTLGVVGGECALDPDGALQGAARAPEGEQEAVALELDLVAPVRGKLLAHDLVVGPDYLARLEVAEALGHLGEALHVGEHEGHRAVRRRGGGEVRSLLVHGQGHYVNGALDGGMADSLELHAQLHGHLEVALHAELVERADGLVGELEGEGGVSGAASGAQHAGALAPCARGPGVEARAIAEADRLLEVAFGVVPALERAGQHPESIGRRARHQSAEADDNVALGVGEQGLVQELGPRAVSEVPAHVTGQGQGGNRIDVLSDLGDLVDAQALEPFPGLVRATRLAEHQGEAHLRNEPGVARVATLLQQMEVGGQTRLQLREPALPPAQVVE
jgi:hypothetical protein